LTGIPAQVMAMHDGLRYFDRTVLLAAVAASGLAVPGRAEEPPALTAARDLVLVTKTPLGEAAIVLPAGSLLTGAEEDGAEFVIRQGPFTARVPREEIAFPPVAAAESAPDGAGYPVTAGAPAIDEPVAEPIRPMAAPVWPWDERWDGDWASLWPAGALVALGAYSLATTIALVFRRRWRY